MRLTWRPPFLHTASRAAAADVLSHQRAWGIGQEWTPQEYGDYYATSANIYAAINIRAKALSRARMLIKRRDLLTNDATPVEATHPLQRLFDRPNPWMAGEELEQLLEIHLLLWGKAFWSIELSDEGKLELWPVPRPDRMVVLPGAGTQYIKGFRYEGLNQDRAFLPEEIVFFRYPNPLQDRTGLSPIAPLRLTDDMGQEARRWNLDTFKNGPPDWLVLADEDITDKQAASFLKRWREKFSDRTMRRDPAVMGGGRTAIPLAFSQREAEFIEGLKWTVEETARVFGVPQPMLGSLREATLANVEALERIFWRQTMLPEAQFLQGVIQHQALPKLGYPNLLAEFDYGNVDALAEDEAERLKREELYLKEGVLSINEVRAERGMPPIAGGDEHKRQELMPRRTDEGQRASLEYAAHSEGRPSNGRDPSGAYPRN